jgi:hypothetical protein
MATIPLWLIGRNVTSVVITPLVADSAGLLSAAALGAQTVTAIVDEIQYSGATTTQEISALTSRRRNEVPLERDDQLVFTEICRSAAGSVIAAAIWTAADLPDWALFQATRGGNSVAFYGLATRYEEDVQKGKSVARITLRIVNAAVTNPAYT